MKSTSIPLFDLASTSDYIVVVGGGGNTDYGKENGIIIFRKTEMNTESTNIFFKTNDLIKGLAVYEEGTEYEDYEVDDLSLDQEDSSENLDSVPEIDSSPEDNTEHTNSSENNDEFKYKQIDSEEKLSHDTEDSNNIEQSETQCSYPHKKNHSNQSDDNFSEQEISNTCTLTDHSTALSHKTEQIFEKTNKKEHSENNLIKKTNKILSEEKSKSFYIAAAGETYFYLLKFDGNLKLLKKMKHLIKKFILTRHLFLLYRNSVYGFYDVPDNFNILKLKAKIIDDNSEKTEEEYFYNLYKKNKRIVYKGEDGYNEISRNWDNFFIYEKKIHKVLIESNKNCFVFKNKKYSFEGRLSDILKVKNMIVFYVIQQDNALLYFINDYEKVYKLPKLTCITGHDNYIAVSTSLGDIIIYKGNEFFSRDHVADMPITGLSIDGKYIYFSILTGLVGKIKIRPSCVSLGFIIAIFSTLIALIIAYYKK